MKYSLLKNGIKKVPFHPGTIIEYQRGFVVDEQEKKLFRYSYSTEPILGKYRVTLHKEDAQTYITYTFALFDHNNQLQIECENAPAMNLMNPLSNTIDITFHQLLTLIMKDGIQNQYS